jgi:hypothetical protein
MPGRPTALAPRRWSNERRETTIPLMTYLSVTRFETRRRLFESELALAKARVAARPSRRRHLLTAVRGAAAA